MNITSRNTRRSENRRRIRDRLEAVKGAEVLDPASVLVAVKGDKLLLYSTDTGERIGKYTAADRSST